MTSLPLTITNTTTMMTSTEVTTGFIDTTTQRMMTSQADLPSESKCLHILYEDISNSRVRIWDLIFLVPNSFFLLFMIYRAKHVWYRMTSSSHHSIFVTYFALVTASVLLSFIRCIVSMTVDLASLSGTDANKILWLILRFFLLMAELSVMVFGLGFGGHVDSRRSIKRVLLVTTSIALIYSTIQTYLELSVDDPRFDSDQKWSVYQHGGCLFALVSSIIFLLLYTFIIILPYINWLQRYFLVPTRRSFYIYVSVMLIINLVSAMGCSLLYANYDFGLCFLDLSTILYFSYFPPLVYWTFLTSYFTSTRPNNILFSYNSQIDDDIDDVVDYDVNAFNVDSSLGGVLEFHQQQPEVNSFARFGKLQQLQDFTQIPPHETSNRQPSFYNFEHS